MKESHGEGLATHAGSESCATGREDGAEALTGVRAGRVLSPESRSLRNADAVKGRGRRNWHRRYRETLLGSALSETRSTYRNTMFANRQILWLPTAHGAMGRVGTSKDAGRR